MLSEPRLTVSPSLCSHFGFYDSSERVVEMQEQEVSDTPSSCSRFLRSHTITGFFHRWKSLNSRCGFVVQQHGSLVLCTVASQLQAVGLNPPEEQNTEDESGCMFPCDCGFPPTVHACTYCGSLYTAHRCEWCTGAPP